MNHALFNLTLMNHVARNVLCLHTFHGNIVQGCTVNIHVLQYCHDHDEVEFIKYIH